MKIEYILPSGKSIWVAPENTDAFEKSEKGRGAVLAPKKSDIKKDKSE